jgi:hypothetical protein
VLAKFARIGIANVILSLQLFHSRRMTTVVALRLLPRAVLAVGHCLQVLDHAAPPMLARLAARALAARRNLGAEGQVQVPVGAGPVTVGSPPRHIPT